MAGRQLDLRRADSKRPLCDFKWRLLRKGLNEVGRELAIATADLRRFRDVRELSD